MGKRGGARVIYFNKLESGVIWLLVIYANVYSEQPPQIMNWDKQGYCPVGNNSQTRYARLPLSIFPPQARARANESQREFYINAVCGNIPANLLRTIKETIDHD
jgi:hypothetical protein